MSKKHHSLIVKFAAFTSEMRTCECPNIGQISTFWNHSKVSIFTIKSNFGKSKHGISQSVQLLSCVRLFVTPWTAARQTSLSITKPQSLLKLMSIESVMPSIQPSHPLSSPFPPTFNPSQYQGLFKWVSSLHQVPKYWSFSFSISSSNEYSGLISFRID